MKKILLLLVMMLVLTGCHQETETQQKTTKNETVEDIQEESMEITMTINGNDHIIELIDNETTRTLVKNLPMTITMEDLNSNEKYHYLSISLPADSKNPGTIEAGDFMLFGNNCLVLFYESFSTSYSYTRLGKVQDVDQFLKDIENQRDIEVTFK